MSALYISPYLSARNFGGSLFSATILELLREAHDTSVIAASISRAPHPAALPVPTTLNKLGTALANLQGLCGTLSKPGVSYLMELLKRERPTLVWLDTSLLGRLIPLIRRVLPNTHIVCGFHNVEAELVKQRVTSGQPQYLPAWYATRHNEALSARASDLILAVHPTDATLIGSRYGRAVDRILPIIVADRVSGADASTHSVTNDDPYLLFVGSAFPPNIEALHFLHQQVAPSLRKFRLIGVGNGLEKYASRFVHPKLKILGFVEDLSALYAGAVAVIAPIFSGGGMKVKIAEALMHGKSVVASPFAAIGFEACSAHSIRLAESADDFARQIARLGEERYNPISRADYEMHYSRSAGLRHVREIVAMLDRTPR